jgi:hypothetical protein
MIWPMQQRLFLEDATPRNLIIAEDIADDHLCANFFGDGGGCHLHIVGKFLEGPPVLAAQREMNRLDLQEVVARLELGYSVGYGSSMADSMSDDLLDVARDVLQAGGHGVAAGVH